MEFEQKFEQMTREVVNQELNNVELFALKPSIRMAVTRCSMHFRFLKIRF
jgi:hypothetical protein